jgi:hypothetical protein
MHWQHMVEHGYAPQWHWVWSDGCAFQFKNSKHWYFVSRYPNMIRGCRMIWSFFNSGHGKGFHDGTRVVVKRFLQRKQLNGKGVKLQIIEEVVAFLHNKLPN